MSSLVTILTIPFPGNVSIIKARLESEGIECYTKDDTTIQVDPLISNAVGGVKLQVREEDVPQAMEILYSEGYANREEVETPVDSYSGLERFAGKLPFFKKLRFEMRLLIWLAFVIVIPTTLIIWAMTPNTVEKLTKQNWCVNRIDYQGKQYRPSTLGIHLTGYNFCDESVLFKPDGAMELPGFNTYAANGRWSLAGDKLIIARADTFKFVYNGTYDIVFSGRDLTLISSTTTIYCYHTF